MRVLIVHNFYGSAAPSGENRVVEAEVDLLRRNGNEVSVYSRFSDEIRGRGLYGFIKGAMATPWSMRSYFHFKKAVDAFGPDVVHVHNTFPLISPSIFYALGRHVTKIMTLHNYRIVCPAAIPMRNGNVCTECIDKRSSLPSIKYGCYRGSRFATLPLACNVSLHRTLGTWTKKIDKFVVLTEFQRNLMVAAGLPKEKMHIKPNFFPGSPRVIDWDKRGRYVIFVGRLSEEKGVRTLINAWRKWGDDAPELRLVGDGELRAELEKMSFGLRVSFLGQLPASEAQEQIASASLLILPSECFEGFPMVIREAFAFGTPVAVSNMQPLPSIVENNVNGVVFSAADSESLYLEVKKAWYEPRLLKKLGRAARTEFENNYNERENYKILMEIYRGSN